MIGAGGHRTRPYRICVQATTLEMTRKGGDSISRLEPSFQNDIERRGVFKEKGLFQDSYKLEPSYCVPAFLKAGKPFLETSTSTVTRIPSKPTVAPELILASIGLMIAERFFS